MAGAVGSLAGGGDGGSGVGGESACAEGRKARAAASGRRKCMAVGRVAAEWDVSNWDVYGDGEVSAISRGAWL